MPTWPNTLPRPRAEGFTRQLPKPFVVFESDKVGVSKRRRVTTAAPETLTFTLTCTAAQLTTLTGFYLNDCAGGALKFTYTHPITGATCQAMFGEEPSDQPRPRTNRFLARIVLKVWA